MRGDHHIRRHGRPIVLAAALGLLGASVAGATGWPVASAQSGPELAGPRETPEIPVRSVPLRGGGAHDGVEPPVRPARCDKDIDTTTTLRGVAFVNAQDNQICTSADLDTYRIGSRTFVVQAGGEEAAFIITDVTNPASPIRVGPFTWARRGAKGTYTPDVKAFSQTVDGMTRQYVALSLERLRLNGFCGVVVLDVTTATPVFETQIYKNTPSDFWCDVHNSFVEDVGGEGRYLYATADARNDMRVIDLANVADFPATCDIATNCAAKETGRYKAPTAVDADNYVHDVTVIDHGGETGRRVYVSYWDTGLVILNAADVTPGTSPTPIVTIDPTDFLTHHAFASADGRYAFLQDELLDQPGDAPVQMWQVDPRMRVDSLVLGTDVPANPAHNLEIRFDLAPNRLYVGWYKLGLQAWDFGTAGFSRTTGTPGRTAAQYHQVQTEARDDPYDGAWGIRIEDIGGCRHFFQSDRRYGLIIDRDAACA